MQRTHTQSRDDVAAIDVWLPSECRDQGSALFQHGPCSVVDRGGGLLSSFADGVSLSLAVFLNDGVPADVWLRLIYYIAWLEARDVTDVRIPVFVRLGL